MNATDYDKAIEKVFNQLDEATHRPKKTFNTDIHAWSMGGLVTAFAICASVPVMYLSGSSTEPNLISNFYCVIGGVLLANSSRSYQSTQKHVEMLAGLFGRSLPLSPTQMINLREWTQKHSRINQSLAKMAAKNPDGELNVSDFNKVQRAYYKAH